MWTLTHGQHFLNWVLVLILLSCLQLAWETYATEEWEWACLSVLDYILTLCFFVEMCCKIISNSLYDAEDAYLRNNANQLDGAIVCVSILSMALSGVDLEFLKSLRTLWCIRPLRVLSRSETMMVVIQALIMSISHPNPNPN